MKNKSKSGLPGGRLDQPEWIALVDQAARGDLDAAAELAEGYFRGRFGEKDVRKALKWASYAAKKGHLKAIELLAEIRR